ncbi:ArsR/SmtB family transcription factor [Alkalibacterium sp. f15]|uniref:ArsR/SmtB family transcription factor n=1 Tax=Alkalibacterium sp. f15 TaxID=3414029 RepID=UPI003BF89A95
MTEEVTYYAELFKVLSDETRLKILQLLSKNQLCACDLIEEFNITQPTLSYHMKILRDKNLVVTQREGNRVLYALDKENVDALISFIQSIGTSKHSVS